MKKYLLSILFLSVSFAASFAQIYCTPSYQSGCSSMFIDGVQLDSLDSSYEVLKSYTLNSNTGCNAGNINGYSAINQGTAKIFANCTYKFSIAIQNSALGAVGVFIDFDGDGIFNPSNELMQNANYYSYGTPFTDVYFTVPTTVKAGLTKMRIVTNYGGNYNSIYDPCFNNTINFGEAEDYDITIVVPPKTVKSITSTTLDYIYQKSFNNNAINFNVETSGITGNLGINKLRFDILNQDSIKYKSIYAFENNDWVAVEGASYVKTTNGVDINFSPPRELPNQNNVFALFYDLDISPKRLSSARVGLDTKITDVIINNVSQVSKIAPQINKIQLVPQLPVFNSSYCTGSSLVQLFQMAQMNDNYNSRVSNCNAVISSSYSPSATLGTTINTVFKAYDSQLNAGIYIDWDGDLMFNSPNEFIDLGKTDSSLSKSIFINVPTQTADTNVFVRLLVSTEIIDKTSATGYFGFSNGPGESRDYILRVKPAVKSNNLISNIKYFQSDSLIVVKGDTNIKALSVVIEADTSSIINLSAINFKFNTGITPQGNIAKAKLWAGNSLNDFEYATQIGTSIINPDGNFIFSTISQLSSGKNYFWITYDIDNNAAFNTIVEAKLVDVTFDNSTIENANLDSAYTIGLLKVVEYIRMTNGVSSTGCNILFTDNGGKKGAFSGTGVSVHEFNADLPTNTLKIKINNLDLGNSGEEGRFTEDTLYVYDGVGVNKTLLKAITQNVFWNELGGVYEQVSDSGSLTFVLKSDTNKTKQGWEGFITCEFNCTKNPISVDFTIDSITCQNENTKIHIDVLKSKTKSYTVSYFDYNNYGEIVNTYNTDTFSVELPTSSYISTIKITNENKCFIEPQLNLPYKYTSFYVYGGDVNRKPSCKKANNGYQGYYLSNNVYDSIETFTAEWNYTKNKISVGSLNNITGNNDVNITGLMFDTAYSIKFSSSTGGCLYEYLTIKSTRSDYDDSTTAVPQSYTPITLDTSFVIGSKLNSDVSVKFLDHFPRLGGVIGNSNFKNELYPDSAKFLINPISVNNKISISTDSSQVSNFEWNNNFSGNIDIKAQLFQGGCKGPISNALKVKIYPTIELLIDTIINTNPKDSSVFAIYLKGTKPFILTVLDKKTLDVYLFKKLQSNKFDLKLPIGNYEIVSISDSFNLVNTLNKPVVIIADTVTNLTYNIVSQPACAGKKGKVKFNSIGGKSPIVYKVYDALSNEIVAGDSVNLVAGLYSVNAVDASGFVTKAESFAIINPITNLITQPTIISPLSPFVTNVDSLTLNVAATVATFNSFKKIVWSISPKSAIINSDSTLNAKLTLSDSISGRLYLRAVTVDTSNCISDSSNVVILNRNAKANFVFNDTTFYIGDSVQFAVKYKGSYPATINYKVGNGLPVVKKISSANSYLTVKNQGAISILDFFDKDSINVLYSHPNINFSVDTISDVVLKVDSISCASQNGYAQVKITGGKPDHTFTVYNLNDSLIATVTAIDPSVALQLGNYKATVKDAGGFYYKDTLYFDIKTGLNPYRNYKPVFTIKPLDSIASGTVSSNFTVNLPGYNTLPNYDWYYSNSNAIISDNVSENDNTISWKPRFTGEVEIKVVADINSCKTDTGYFKLKIKPSVKLIQKSNGDVVVKFNGTSPFRINYNFDNKSSKDSTITIDSLIIPNSGATRIYVTLVGDANYNTGFGGELGLINNLPVTGSLPVEIFQAFSPENGDNINDIFVIKNLPNGLSNFQVLDRNGFIVYNNSAYKNDWNGRDNSGNPVIDGVYYFVITGFDSIRKEKYRYAGPIEIRR